MKRKNRRKPDWLRKWLSGAALGLGFAGGYLHAEEPAKPEPAWIANPAPQPATEFVPAAPAIPESTWNGSPTCDPLAPAWCDPVSRIPNMFGQFFATGDPVTQNTISSQTLHFTGSGAEGEGFTIIVPPVTVNGPGGPY